jgi:hypothetical protein
MLPPFSSSSPDAEEGMKEHRSPSTFNPRFFDRISASLVELKCSLWRRSALLSALSLVCDVDVQLT